MRRVVVTGMGKSGHIAGKLAATLASTGTPAFFVHPGEASHGDLGMITATDVVLALSNSGETGEIITILPIIKRLHVPLIAMTGNPESTLSRKADANIHVGVEKEACPLDLAPTASTTAALAMGDAMAVSLLQTRGFTEEDFARSHPGGSLGRRLLLLIDDIMHTGAAIPVVHADTLLSNALVEMTQKGLGMTAVLATASTWRWQMRTPPEDPAQLEAESRQAYEDGEYLSRVLDLGEVATWDQIQWDPGRQGVSARERMLAPAQPRMHPGRSVPARQQRDRPLPEPWWVAARV